MIILLCLPNDIPPSFSLCINASISKETSPPSSQEKTLFGVKVKLSRKALHCRKKLGLSALLSKLNPDTSNTSLGQMKLCFSKVIVIKFLPQYHFGIFSIFAKFSKPSSEENFHLVCNEKVLLFFFFSKVYVYEIGERRFCHIMLV